jgi:hypothetical protein
MWWVKKADFIFGTLIGNIILVQCVFAVPMLIVGFVANAKSGTLNLRSATEMAIIVSGAATFAAAGLWFTVIRDLSKRRWPGGPPS